MFKTTVHSLLHTQPKNFPAHEGYLENVLLIKSFPTPDGHHQHQLDNLLKMQKPGAFEKVRQNFHLFYILYIFLHT